MQREFFLINIDCNVLYVIEITIISLKLIPIIAFNKNIRLKLIYKNSLNGNYSPKIYLSHYKNILLWQIC